MNNLKKILLAGSLLLTPASCGGNEKILTDENFAKAEWISAPYTKETRVWSGYVAERDSTWSDKNLKIYYSEVAKRNGFTYKTDSTGNMVKIIGYDSDSILLPDLDGNGYVQFKIGEYATKKKSSSANPQTIVDDKSGMK